jgi:outer membrane protein
MFCLYRAPNIGCRVSPLARTGFALAFCVAILLGGHLPASAESLKNALASAYKNNPTLNAERAKLRATDEGVAEAKAGFRPSLSGTGDVGVRNIQTDTKTSSSTLSGSGLFAEGTLHPKGYAFTLNQSLFRGLRTINGLREAEANVRAGREQLRSVEQTVLLNAVTAYMDVVRDQAITKLRENNVTVLTEQQTATKDRFEVGEVTKTDVAQADARRAGAVSQLNAAQGNLQSSRAVYEQVIGIAPSYLKQPPPIESILPQSLPDALGIGNAENPEILSAVHLEEAARFAIKQIIGETLPEIDVEARFQERFEPSFTTLSQEEATVTGRLTVPLYSGGAPSARVRAARNTQSQRRREIDAAREKTRADVVSAWSQLVSARAQLVSDEAQVRANKIALDGVREEEKVGQRTYIIGCGNLSETVSRCSHHGYKPPPHIPLSSYFLN